MCGGFLFINPPDPGCDPVCSNAQKRMSDKKPRSVRSYQVLSFFPSIFIPAERMNNRDATVLSGEDPFTLV